MSYQKFTKDIGLIGLANLAIALRGLIILPVITKLLGPASYGLWAQLIVAVYLLAPLATLGLPYTLVRFLAAEKSKEEIREGLSSVFLLIFGFTLLIALSLVLFSSPLAKFIQADALLIKLLSGIVLFESLNLVFLNVFRAFQQIKRYAFFMVFQSLGEAGLAAGAVLLGYGLFGALLALLIIRVINFFITGLIITKEYGFKRPNFSRLRNYLRFGLPTVPGQISSWFLHFNDRYLIGFFLGPLFAGYYVPAYTLGQAIAFFEAPLSFALPAALSKAYDEKRLQEVKTILRYSLKYFLLITIPAFFGLSILAKPLLTLFSTAEIAQQAFLVLPFMALSMLLYGLYGIIPQILILVKKTSILGKVWLGVTVLNLGMNIALIPRFGIMAAAVNTLLAYTIILGITWYYSFKHFRFEIDWRFIGKSIFASLLMALFLLWLAPGGTIETFLAIVAGTLIYSLLIFLFKGFEKKEFDFFRNLLKTIKSSRPEAKQSSL